MFEFLLTLNTYCVNLRIAKTGNTYERGTTMSVFRVYVEKRKGFDVEVKRMKKELKEFLHIENVNDLRILNRYDIEYVNEAAYKKALNTIFSEPQSDVLFEEDVEKSGNFTFAVSFLRGQYDQRADSCVQCIRTIDSTLNPIVKTAKVYMLEGEFTEAEKEKIKKSVINPVESEEVSLEKVDSLDMTYPVPEDVKVLEGFIDMDEVALEAFRKKEGLAMSLEDLAYFQNYFKSENRNPSYTELKVVDTYWSDHCRHTTFMTELIDIEVEDGKFAEPIKEALEGYYSMREELGRTHKKVCLMDMATVIVKYLKEQGKLKELVESEEINACTIEESIDVSGKKEDYLILFKNETHNHPTEIEPFGGAATCLVVRFVTHFQEEVTYIKQCVSQEQQILMKLSKILFQVSFHNVLSQKQLQMVIVHMVTKSDLQLVKLKNTITKVIKQNV